MKITDFAAKDFNQKTEDERNTILAGLEAPALDAALAEGRTEATALFAKDPEALTVADADEAEALNASLGYVEAEQARRAKIASDAAARFAAAKQTFSVNDGVEDSEDADAEGDDSEDADAEGDDEDADAEGGDDSEDADADAGDADAGEAVTTAAAVDHARNQRMPKPSAASKVGKATKRPNVKSAPDVTITAAADVEGFSNGQTLTDMTQVAEAVMSRVKGFPKFNSRAAAQVSEQSGGQPVLNRFGAASFGVNIDKALTAGAGAESGHAAAKEAVKRHVERIKASISGDPVVNTAAMAWCSPSEVMYNWIADYVVDGLLDLPEIAAPRGGLMLTEGPRLAQTTYDDSEVGIGSTYDDADEPFGFGGTEAEMEAGYIKTCETIECPEFVDHRLDFTGYCWKIPILTEATFPELVADAMRLSDVAFAHKMNRRFIGDVVRGSTEIDATNALGGVQMDTLEAFTQVAIKERRWWNIGENAVMEVKLPQEAKAIFQFDMGRRSGLALNDIATEQKVAAHFAAHNLAVTYVADFNQRYGGATPTTDWPETIKGIMYPAGTWVKSVKPVINLSAVYDAASLSENEYTGVFFEQGVMTIRRGYRSHVIEVPVCVAGRTGALDLTCSGFDVPALGSF